MYISLLFQLYFSSVQFICSYHVWLFNNSWAAARQGSQSTTNFWSLLKLISIKSVVTSNHLILCCLLLLLPSIIPSSRVFYSDSVIRMSWPKYWSSRISISPLNVYSGVISFTMDWFNLLAVQGTLQEFSPTAHSSKASILLCSAFFINILKKKSLNHFQPLSMGGFYGV